MCAAPRERGGSSRRRGRASDQHRPKPENVATSGTSEATSSPPLVRIGVMADTHGYLDPAVLELFAGVTHIVHAGDIMDPQILASLATVAPVTAVAGNLDTGKLADTLPREASGELPGVGFVVCHKRKRLLKRLAAGKIAIGPKGLAPNLVVSRSRTHSLRRLGQRGHSFSTRARRAPHTRKTTTRPSPSSRWNQPDCP